MRAVCIDSCIDGITLHKEYEVSNLELKDGKVYLQVLKDDYDRLNTYLAVSFKLLQVKQPNKFTNIEECKQGQIVIITRDLFNKYSEAVGVAGTIIAIDKYSPFPIAIQVGNKVVRVLPFDLTLLVDAESGCEFCQLPMKHREYLLRTEEEFGVYIDNNGYLVSHENSKVFRRKINNCPMCGRKL